MPDTIYDTRFFLATYAKETEHARKLRSEVGSQFPVEVNGWCGFNFSHKLTISAIILLVRGATKATMRSTASGLCHRSRCSRHKICGRC